MNEHETSAFKDVPHTARGHFLLNFYASVFRFINYIQHLSEVGGDNLDKTFEKYPFLDNYFKEISQYMDINITWTGGITWWEEEITAWEQSTDGHLPLVALQKQCGIDFKGRIALMIVDLVEEDSRFGTLFADLQEPLGHRRPCLELVEQIMKIDAGDHLSICRSLLTAHLLDAANRDAPRSEWVLFIPSMLSDVIRGDEQSDQAAWCDRYPSDNFPRVNELICNSAFRERLDQIPALVKEDGIKAIVLRGPQGGGMLQFMGAVAREMDLGVVEVDGSKSFTEEHWKLLGPFCSITGSLPVITYDLGPGETEEVPHLTCFQGPVGIIMGSEGGLRGRSVEKTVTLNLPSLNGADRMLYWDKALAGYEVEDLAEICERFHIPGGYIDQAASMAATYAALDRSEVVNIAHIREACRTLNRQMLDTLATRMEVGGSWNQLVVSNFTESKLRELEIRCHHRERLLEHLGPGFGSGTNRGVRALFTGSSGTGKTLAANILAAELGMDLYRVDLAAVINKYIGETEKNLHRILSRAEELDVILLLDEGDALLGTRTAVKSANDRYANLETDYLLQRLENYQGIVVVTTNTEGNIDTAFKRRMDVVVNFVSPQAQQRLRIWQLHLPEGHDVDETFLEEVAWRCALTGGQIRNAALHATMLALDNGSNSLTMQHIRDAVHSEYRKAGALCPLNEKGQVTEAHGGMEAFLQILKQASNQEMQ
jgi:hypothetical protein